MTMLKRKKNKFRKMEVENEEDNEEIEKNPIEDMRKGSVTEPKEKIIVVKELPMQPVRQAKTKDGDLITYLTIEEALTEFLNEEEE